MSDFYNKYPYTDFHELNLDWVIERVKQLTEDWISTKEAWEGTEADWQELYNYVHDYFNNLDVQDEINAKINAMIADGSFTTIVTPIIDSQVANTVAAWLAQHITPTTPAVDDTLTVSGAAADSETTGLIIADPYDNTSTYAFDDYVNHNGSLYRAIRNINAAESFTAAHWKKRSVSDELSNINSFLFDRYVADFLFSASDTAKSVLIDNKFVGRTVLVHMSDLDSDYKHMDVNVLYDGDESYTNLYTTYETKDFEISIPICRSVRIGYTKTSGTAVTYKAELALIDRYAQLIDTRPDINNINYLFNQIHEDTSQRIYDEQIIRMPGYTINYQTNQINSVYNAKGYSLCFPCKPNTVYSITKLLSRFVIAWTADMPHHAGTTYDAAGYTSIDSVLFTTGATAKYIMIFYYYDDDVNTYTETEVFNSFRIVGKNISACDNYLRENSINALIGAETNYTVNVETCKMFGTGINTVTGQLNNNYNASLRSLYFKCKPSTRYSVTKMLSARFVIGELATEPQLGATCSSFESDSGATNIDITTSASTNYLIIFYYNAGSDTETEENIRKSITITEGSPASVIVSKNGYYKHIYDGVGAVAANGSVFVTSGTYEEQIDTRAKNVNIIGLDKNSCILKDTSGMYLTPPLEISGGSVQNMTIIETGEDSTPSSPGTNPTLAYCIHVDFDQEKNNSLLISNCILRCNKRAAIGSGVRNNFKMIIENCDIWSGEQEDTDHAPRGAVYIHCGATSTLDPGETNNGAIVKLINNQINCDDRLTLCFEKYSPTVGIGFDVTSINNMVYSAVSGKTSACIEMENETQFDWSVLITNNSRSYGNNVTLLNA